MNKSYLVIVGAISFLVALYFVSPEQPPGELRPGADQTPSVVPEPGTTIETADTNLHVEAESVVEQRDDQSTGYPEVGEMVPVGDTYVVSTGGPDNWAPWLKDDEANVRLEAEQQGPKRSLPPPDANPEALIEMIPELDASFDENAPFPLSYLTGVEDAQALPPGTIPPRRPYFEPPEDRE